MEILENISQWLDAHPVSSNVIKYLIWAVFILLAIAFLRRFFKT
ncbi:hypothetical protein [Bizionia psychrotolerans]|nr:hypothetical protein [Bizionia psychrotolerans]